MCIHNCISSRCTWYVYIAFTSLIIRSGELEKKVPVSVKIYIEVLRYIMRITDIRRF